MGSILRRRRRRSLRFLAVIPGPDSPIQNVSSPPLHTNPYPNPHYILTPYKRYIQMSGMILGGMLEADKRMVNYQHRVRYQKKIARDMEIWRRYEDAFEEKGTPGVGSESGVHGPDGK